MHAEQMYFQYKDSSSAILDKKKKKSQIDVILPIWERYSESNFSWIHFLLI